MKTKCNICKCVRVTKIDLAPNGSRRGQLCGRCYKVIRLFKESPELLRKAASIIENGENI